MEKKFIFGGITVGGIVGAYLPVWLFHVDSLSFLSLLGGTIGSFVGLYAGYKFSQNMGD
jgi:gas vesicle protein